MIRSGARVTGKGIVKYKSKGRKMKWEEGRNIEDTVCNKVSEKKRVISVSFCAEKSRRKEKEAERGRRRWKQKDSLKVSFG